MQDKVNEKMLFELAEKLSVCPEDAMIVQYLNDINRDIQKTSVFSDKIYQEKQVGYAVEQKPFLSIVIRTQGKRVEMLRETFLTLMGQEDMDYEIILIGHKVVEEQKEKLYNVLLEYPSEFLNRTRLIFLDSGNRTSPLNLGFGLAKGEYVVALDDDDIVYANWVSEFHKASKCNPGKTLHAYVLAQKWRIIEAEHGQNALRSIDKPTDIYCKDFSFLYQLKINYCPLMGMAFPRYAFKDMGIVFDETLNTQEDWDFLSRITRITGVCDISVPTALYRLWDNSDNSHAVHDESKWENDYEKVRGSIKEKVALMPMKKTMDELDELLDPARLPVQKVKDSDVTYQLFYRKDNDFNEKDSVKVDAAPGYFDITYELNMSEIEELRLDPGEQRCILRLETIEIIGDDSCVQLVPNQIISNAICKENCYYFNARDPQLIWSHDGKEIKKIRVQGVYNVIDCSLDDLGHMISVVKKKHGILPFR